MTLTAPPDLTIRGLRGYGSVIPTADPGVPDAPTVTVTAASGRRLLVDVTGVENISETVTLQSALTDSVSDGDWTTVAQQPWFALEQYDTGDIGESETLFFRARATNEAGNSAWSATDSDTTGATLPAPGEPYDLLVTDNSDGTADFSWALADAYNETLDVQIWVQGSTSWVNLVDLDGTPAATSALNVAIPGSSGATVNGSGEYGFRIRVSNNAGGNIAVSSSRWAAINDAGATVTAGVLGTVVVVSSSSLRVPLSTAPTGYTTMQLQRSLTGGAEAADWSNIAGVDAESDFTGGGYLDTGRSAATQYFYRLEVSDGVDTVYSNTVSATTQASGGTAIYFEDTLTSGFKPDWSVGAKWSAESGFARVTYTGAGTSGTQLKYVFPEKTYRELWVAFDIRANGATNGGAKTCKVHGVRTNSGATYSNVTFHGLYTSDDWYGAAYGNATSGANDTQRSAKFNGTSVDPNSPDIDYVYLRGSNLPIPRSSFGRVQIHWKQNSAPSTHDGQLQWYLDEVLQADVRNMKNRGDDSSPFDFITLGDYTASNESFSLDYRNFALSFSGMPD